MAVGIDTAGLYKVIRVDNADTATGWKVVKLEGSGGAPSLLGSVGTIDLVAEGTDARAARTNKQRVLIAFDDAAGYDFTSGSTGNGTNKVPDGLAYIWAAFLAAGNALTKANGGLQICLGDGTNRSYWNVAGSDTYTGGLIKWAAFTGIAPDETSGTAADLGDITEIGFVTDVGTGTTRFDNFVVDAIDVGDGLTINGTTANDKLFSEAATADAATAIQVLEQDGGTTKAQGSIALSGTNLVSDSETLEFSDEVGGAYTYNLTVSGAVSMVNTAIQADGLVDYIMDTSGATSFSMTGGGIKKFLSLITGSGQTISGVVMQSGGTSTINNIIQGGTFGQCGKINIAAGQLDGVVVDKNTASEATSGTDTTKVKDCTINRDTGVTSHAFELTGATKGSSYSWSASCTGYDAGTTGNGVQVTGGSITGNEHIYIPATTGTFDISVADGASVPSVATGGAIVNVTANQITISVTVLDDETGAAIGTTSRVYLVRSSDKSVLLNGAVNASGVISTQIDFDSETAVEGWARDMDLSGNDYVPASIGGTYTADGLSITVRLKKVI